MSDLSELRDHVTTLEAQYVFIRETLGEIKTSVASQGNDIMALKLDVAEIKMAQRKLTNGGNNIMVSKRAVLGLFGVGVTAAGAALGVVQKLIGG